jgi:molecular chaperone Hsp33
MSEPMSMPSGRLVRAFTGGRAVRLLVVEAHGPARKAAMSHGLGPGASQLASEGVVATALLSSHIKGEERITLQVQGEAPRFAFIGEVDAEGFLRARLTPADAHTPDSQISGMMLVIKADAQREVYRGVTAVSDTSIEAALAQHLVTSSQVDAILRLGAAVDADGVIEYAGGFIVERLPEDPRYPSMTPEQFHATYGPLLEADLQDVLTGIAFGKLAGSDVEVLESRAITWRCRCSPEKVETMLGSLGVEELRAMQAEGGAEVSCHFCNEVYRVSVERLEQLAMLYLDN